MAPPKTTPLTTPLRQVLGQRAVATLAKRLGVLQRRRKVDAFILVWTLVLGFQVGSARSLEGLRHVYQRASGQSLVRSSFYERLSPKLAKLMYRLAQNALAAQLPGSKMPTGQLEKFKEVLAIDASVLRLHKLLSKAFEGCRTNHTRAAAKLHVIMNVFDGSAVRVKLTGERTHDAAPWRRVGKWVQGRLLLFDLGYTRYHLFYAIDLNGGFFLTRMKKNANPIITSANRVWPGRSRDLVGLSLQDALEGLRRGVLDVQVRLRFKKRMYRGKQRWTTAEFRLVALRNEDTGEYHVYLTNIPVEALDAEQVRSTYALRWQVEILFKAMKSHGHLDHLPSSKRCIVECFVWASVLGVVASQALYRAVRESVPSDRHMPLLRWSALISRCTAELLLMLTSNGRSRCQSHLWDQLVRDAPDPNRSRKNRSFQEVPCLAAV